MQASSLFKDGLNEMSKPWGMASDTLALWNTEIMIISRDKWATHNQHSQIGL